MMDNLILENSVSKHVSDAKLRDSGQYSDGRYWKSLDQKNRTKKPLKSTSFHCLETHLQ